MEFTSTYLSAANLANIFIADSINAEVVEDDHCIIRKQYISSLWIDLEENMIRFSSHISTFNLNNSEIETLVHKMNNEIGGIKTTYDEYTNPNGSQDLLFSYDHLLNQDSEICPKHLLFLHYKFEYFLYQASLIYREQTISQDSKYKQLELPI